MEIDPFQKLTQQELYELTLCGISCAGQLLKTDVDTVLGDLEKAQQHFPEKQFTLNRTKLESIFILCLPLLEHQDASDESNDLQVENVGPTTGFRQSVQHKSKRQIQRIKKEHQQILHSPVRTAHPWTTLFAALCTLLLIIPAVSVFVLPVMMATDNLPDVPLSVLAFICIIAPTIPYLIYSRIALCPVCHIRTFTFGDYARNRSAHYIPGLGYNVATALNILFRRQYFCPGCGTPIKLTRSKTR